MLEAAKVAQRLSTLIYELLILKYFENANSFNIFLTEIVSQNYRIKRSSPTLQYLNTAYRSEYTISYLALPYSERQ